MKKTALIAAALLIGFCLPFQKLNIPANETAGKTITVISANTPQPPLGGVSLPEGCNIMIDNKNNTTFHCWQTVTKANRSARALGHGLTIDLARADGRQKATEKLKSKKFATRT